MRKKRIWRWIVGTVNAAQAEGRDGCKMGMTPGWIMVAAGSLGGIACVLFLVSTIGRFRRQRKHLLEEISME
ncbi:MAG: hypothetical protein ACLTKE_02615 [Coprococcus sp.]